MPNFYSLTQIGETEIESLVMVDEKMCANFNATPDPVHWYHNWESNIGLMLALGYSWGKVKEVCLDDGTEYGRTLAAITEWLEARYTVNAWAEIGGRR